MIHLPFPLFPPPDILDATNYKLLVEAAKLCKQRQKNKQQRDHGEKQF